MTPVILIQLVRLGKFLGVFALVAGSIGAVMPGDLARRRTFAYAIAGPGLGATWAFGILLTFMTGRSLLTTFVLGGFFLSLIVLHGVLYAVGREGRAGGKNLALVVVSLVVATALMVFKP